MSTYFVPSFACLRREFWTATSRTRANEQAHPRRSATRSLIRVYLEILSLYCEFTYCSYFTPSLLYKIISHLIPRKLTARDILLQCRTQPRASRPISGGYMPWTPSPVHEATYPVESMGFAHGPQGLHRLGPRGAVAHRPLLKICEGSLNRDLLSLAGEHVRRLVLTPAARGRARKGRVCRQCRTRFDLRESNGL